MEPEQRTAIEHFIRIARRGRTIGASGGEKAAYHFARSILKHVGSIDGQALLGAQIFIDFATRMPNTARDLLDARNQKAI